MLRWATLLVGAMLFAQAALALAVCSSAQRAPAQALTAMSEMPCCQHADGTPGFDGNANLCLVHCTADAQSVDITGLSVPAASTAAVLTLAGVREAGCSDRHRLLAASHSIAAPPLIILLQVFRI